MPTGSGGAGQVRRLLDAAPAPAVRVDAAALFRAAAERQARRLRRWRGVALAACVAAILLFAFSALSRLEVRVETNQMVVRWGPAPAAPPSAQAPPVAPTPAADPRDLMALEDRVRTLSELVQALADDGREREYQRDLENARLKQLVQQWQGMSDRRWSDMEKDFDALYIAEFQTLKGAKP